MDRHRVPVGVLEGEGTAERAIERVSQDGDPVRGELIMQRLGVVDRPTRRLPAARSSPVRRCASSTATCSPGGDRREGCALRRRGDGVGASVGHERIEATVGPDTHRSVVVPVSRLPVLLSEIQRSAEIWADSDGSPTQERKGAVTLLRKWVKPLH